MLSDNISVNILDVLSFKWKKPHCHTPKRPFNALSLRLSSESDFLYKGQKIRAENGCVSFVPAGVEYDRITKGDDMIVFHFDMSGFVTEEIQVFTPPDAEVYRKLFKQALNIWRKKEPGYKYAATAVFYQILSRLTIDGSVERKTGSQFVSDSARFIEAHFSDPNLGIKQLAERACVSEAYFRKKFGELYGVSPKKYLTTVRIQYAMSLLRTEFYSQKEIAEMCGFSDVKYFRTAFKAKTGKSAKEFKTYNSEAFEKYKTPETKLQKNF